MEDIYVPKGYVQDYSTGILSIYKVVTEVTMKRHEAYIDCIKDGARLVMPKTGIDWEIIHRLSKGNSI